MKETECADLAPICRYQTQVYCGKNPTTFCDLYSASISLSQETARCKSILNFFKKGTGQICIIHTFKRCYFLFKVIFLLTSQFVQQVKQVSSQISLTLAQRFLILIYNTKGSPKHAFTERSGKASKRTCFELTLFPETHRPV